MKAVIDRFEGETAILILGAEEQRLNVPRQLLPHRAKEGSWLQLELVDGQPIHIALDEQETVSARQRIAEKFARLLRGGRP